MQIIFLDKKKDKYMQKTIHASFFHSASNKQHDLYTHCLTGPWCGYKQDRISSKHFPGLIDAVIAKSDLCIKDYVKILC